MSDQENLDKENAALEAALTEDTEPTPEAPEVVEAEVEETEENPNPWKITGFENEEEFGQFVEGAKGAKSELDAMRAEFDAFKAGASSQEANVEPTQPAGYPYTGYTADDYNKEDVQEAVNQYAVEFFRSPKEQVIELIADDVEMYVNARIAEALETRDTKAHVSSKADYLTENTDRAEALKKAFPGISDVQLLTILETDARPEPAANESPEDARDADARGDNTETGKAPRTGPTKSRQSFSEVENEEERMFLNQISRLVN